MTPMLIRVVSLALAFGGLGLAIFADKKSKKLKDVKTEKPKAVMPQLKPKDKKETPPDDGTPPDDDTPPKE